MDKYTKAMLDYASKLDALTESCGEINNLANVIVQNKGRNETILILRKIAEISSGEYKVEIKKIAAMLKDSIVRFYGHAQIVDICSNEQKISGEDAKSLPELLDELKSLTGLKAVKNKVYDLIAYQRVQQLRQKYKLHTVKSTLHMAFTGNPGTGKTTVARIVGRIYKQIGVLSKGHFIEVSRTDLIAGYQGQTALKVKSVIEKAKGGVLFIDEAYSITENDNSDSYGRECLTELTKALEDYRNDLVVIVAGYTEPMRKFFESNPGLKSRFNTFIEFEDYSADELETILESMCVKNDYELSENVRLKIHDYLCKIVEEKDNNFANGRMVRNLYDDLVMNQARRVIKIDHPNKNDLMCIKEEDFVKK